MLKKCIVSMVAVVGAAGVYVPQAVAENVAATGKECAITVESGTVKWGHQTILAELHPWQYCPRYMEDFRTCQG